MKYTIYKDENPEKTVKKIKNIIDEIGLQIEEKHYPLEQEIQGITSYPLMSLRVETVNYDIGGTNGKGTSIENARASAYAEYMERLQNLALGDLYDFWAFSKDRTNLSQISLNFKNNFLNTFFDKDMFSPNSTKYKRLEKCVFLPFYNIKRKTTYDLPHNIISFLQGTNGMSAGNTYEEALVQGLSEVVERYSAKIILCNNVPLATIPKEEFLKYDNISKSLDFFEQKGFNVYIKDASLGGKLPVICTIFESNGIICPVFGAHPSLPIAIERTLTEFVQGRCYSKDLISLIKDMPLPYFSKEKYYYTEKEDIHQSITTLKTFFEKNPHLEKIFFTEQKGYKFQKDTWIDENKQYNNKSLLKFLIDKVYKVTDEIFIRDVSFLGFPSFSIFIPQVSELRKWNKKEIYKLQTYIKWKEYTPKNKNNNIYTTKSLFELAEYYTGRNMFWADYLVRFSIPLEYIGFLCSILLKKPNKIKKFLNIMKGQNKIFEYFTDNQIQIFDIINHYFRLSRKYKDENSITTELKKYYKKIKIKQALKIINELTFKEILSLSIQKSSTKKGQNTKPLIKKLIKCIQNDIPNQMEMEKHLSFLYE